MNKITNSYADTIFMTFPVTNATEWEHFEVIFNLNENENIGIGCENCYAAFYITNNGWPKWNQNVSWAIKNVEFFRLSNNISYEKPITDFYHENVEIARMKSLDEVNDVEKGLIRRNCPHEESNLYEWHDANTWDNGIIPNTSVEFIYIPIGKSVIIRACSLESSQDNPYQRV